jgi:2-amino-4-hydroxy-6-hydroxymethyldihydropteridine diphosphokinase
LAGLAQPDYVNAAAGLLTQLDVHRFFETLRALEVRLGRPASRERWAARCIDLDLLLFGQLRLDDAELTVPHPGLLERNFVLIPLAELAPELNVPGHGPVAELADRLGREGLWSLDDTESADGA